MGGAIIILSLWLPRWVASMGGALAISSLGSMGRAPGRSMGLFAFRRVLFLDDSSDFRGFIEVLIHLYKSVFAVFIEVFIESVFRSSSRYKNCASEVYRTCFPKVFSEASWRWRASF